MLAVLPRTAYLMNWLLHAHGRVSDLAPPLQSLFQACEERLGYTFSDKQMLQAVLTHASGAEHRLASNERLEFLADAILGAVVCEMLFRQFPQYLEGGPDADQVDRGQPSNVCEDQRGLGMQDFLILGKGMTTFPSRSRRRRWPTFLIARGGHVSRWRQRGSLAPSSPPNMAPEIELAAGGRDGQQL